MSAFIEDPLGPGNQGLRRVPGDYSRLAAASGGVLQQVREQAGRASSPAAPLSRDEHLRILSSVSKSHDCKSALLLSPLFRDPINAGRRHGRLLEPRLLRFFTFTAFAFTAFVFDLLVCLLLHLIKNTEQKPVLSKYDPWTLTFPDT